jgi:hypothetical protein
MRVIDEGTVFVPPESPACDRVASFTSLFVDSRGDVIAGFQLGSAKHGIDASLRLCRRRAGEREFTTLVDRFPTTFAGRPGTLAGAELIEPEPGRWLLATTWFDRSEPERPLFDPVTEGLLRSKQLACESTDRGQTWSQWRELPTPGLTGCALTGPLIPSAEGALGLTFESFKEFDDPTPARHGAWLLISEDGGRSFPKVQLVARDEANQVYYWDQRLCPTADRRGFVAAFWTHDRKSQRDLPVHLARGRLGAEATSQPINTGIVGQIAAPAELPDGRLALFVVDRNTPPTMTLWMSNDGGQTWPADQRLVVYNHDEQGQLTQTAGQIDFVEYWEDMRKWTFGHPSLRPLPTGELLATWYAGVPGWMGVRWAMIDVSHTR